MLCSARAFQDIVHKETNHRGKRETLERKRECTLPAMRKLRETEKGER